MKPLRVLVLRSAIAFALALSALGQEGPERDTLLARARSLVQAGDFDAAWKVYDAAVALDPHDLESRMQRAMFHMTVRGMVVEEQREHFASLAREDLAFVASAKPDLVVAGVARDMLAQLDGRILFPDPSVECPSESMAARAEGEQLFQADDYERAFEHYARAAELCPGDPMLRVYCGDALHGLERYAEASEHYRRALEIEPWMRSAHRFLAGTEWMLGNHDEAVRQAVLAVVSDPTYEAGWARLRDYCTSRGRAFLRVYAVKARVVPTEDGTESAIPVPAGDADGSTQAWLAYAASCAGETVADAPGVLPAAPRASSDGGEDAEPASPLAVERRAVEFALKVVAETGEELDDFWRLLLRARDAGFLDEAILVHLVDEALAPTYVEHRAQHSDRLVEYVERLLVPPLESGEAKSR